MKREQVCDLLIFLFFTSRKSPTPATITMITAMATIVPVLIPSERTEERRQDVFFTAGFHDNIHPFSTPASPAQDHNISLNTLWYNYHLKYSPEISKQSELQEKC